MGLEQSNNKLRAYWRGLTAAEKKALAADTRTSVNYLRQVFLYGRRAGAVMAADLGKRTCLGAVSFRPDVFSS